MNNAIIYSCKLCGAVGKNVKLCRSHIIPEFMYKDLYDSNHTYHVYSGDEQKSISKKQIGIREYLFCAECEKKLNYYENYAEKVLTSHLWTKIKQIGNKIVIEDVDTARLKIFQLSLFWRASISSSDIFDHFKIDEEVELRQIILTGQFNGNAKIKCFVLLSKGAGFLKELIQPWRIPLNSSAKFAYVISAAGFHWAYMVFESVTSDSFPADKMTIFDIGSINSLEDFLNLVSEDR